MKQTAVEWLDNAIKDLIPNDIGSQLKYKNKIEQAKKMEKEQMDNVWHDSRIEDFGDEYIGKQTSFNDYFNKTYNTKEK